MTPHFPIYMDYGATTPVDPRVVDAMIPWLREHFGNPSSRSHAWGWEAEEAVERARGQVAALIGADPREIVWTSGATESNNLALKGAAHFYSTRGPGGGYSLGRGAESITVADIIVAVDEPIDATGCAGKENCMGDDTGRCMTHDLWASLNVKMIEFLDSISLKKLVDEQLAKGVSIEEVPVRRAISTQPVVKPIKVNAPNSVFALGNAFSK